MALGITRSLTVLALAAMPLAGLTAAFTVLGVEAVQAGNGNGGGNGNGNGGGNGGGNRSSSEERGNGRGNGNGHGADREHGSNGRGAIASELKGLNACHASDQARESADPESQVGRIAGYADAVDATAQAKDEWDAAFAEYETFKDTYTGPDSATIQASIDALDPSSETYDADLVTLTGQKDTAVAYETELNRLGTLSNDLHAKYEAAGDAEDEALDVASGGRELSDEARQALQDCLEG